MSLEMVCKDSPFTCASYYYCVCCSHLSSIIFHSCSLFRTPLSKIITPFQLLLLIILLIIILRRTGWLFPHCKCPFEVWLTLKETMSSQTGPNGVRESRRSLQDSRSGVERVRVERALGDKGGWGGGLPCNSYTINIWWVHVILNFSVASISREKKDGQNMREVRNLKNMEEGMLLELV